MSPFRTHHPYTLDPLVEDLSFEQQRILGTFLGRHGDRLGIPVVRSARCTAEHHIFELETEAGPVLALERRAEQRLRGA